MILLPFELWFARNANLALPFIYLSYKEQEISINIHDLGSDTFHKKYKERKQIDELCKLFNELTLPITYESYIANTISENKNIIDNINNEEKEWLEK